MSSPTPIHPSEHTNSQLTPTEASGIPTPKYRLPKYAWPAILVAIAVASFVIGQRLSPAPEPTVIENGSPVSDAGALPLPDGKGGEKFAEVEPQPVPEDIASFAYPKEIPFHADIAKRLEKAYPPDAEYSELLGTKGFSLGPVTVGGKPYRLEMHEIKTGGLGTSFATYYVLTSDEAYDFLLSDRVALNGPFGGTATYVNAADAWPVLEEASDRIRYKTNVRIPMLEMKAVVDASGETYHSLGITRRYTHAELQWLAASSDCTKRTPAVPLCLILPQGHRPEFDSDGGMPVVNDAFWRVRPDARVEWYVQDIPFRASGDEKVSDSFVPAITWTDGGAKGLSYIQGQIGGCGVGAAVDVVDAGSIGDLKVAGTYAVGGKSGEVSVATTIDETDWIYTFWKNDHPDGTTEQFAATRPYFYWEDSLGRLLKFTSTEAVPPAECGKPVIYLYPEETTDVSVKVDPKGGFTYTDPEYGTGWEVVAQSDGALTNKADGKAYPYLFWEGRGGLYQSPEKFWVVARADVPSFITATLGKLGLNEKEIADFNEFWLPRMEAAAYYKIGFHGTRVMDALAPLTVSPRPDSVFRVLMDYEELPAPIKSNPPTLPNPFVRDGFTVVEWGGVLR